MAKTFYGYAEREAGSYVDWSQIGKNITDMLQEEVVRRETLKKELADASTAYGETLANAPTGLHEGANDAIISFADNAQQARLMQDRLLKSGQLKVKDYLLQRENLTQGTKGIFNVAKNFQEKVAYKVERMKNNESQYLEQYLFELTEGFGNFNKAGIYINPTNFEVSAAKKIQKTGPNGEVYYEMSNDPKDFLTTNEMNNFISVDLDRFDDTKAVEDLSTQVGARLQQDYIYDKGRKSFITRAISDASGDVFRKMVEQGELTEDEINLVNRFRGQVDKEFDSWLSNPFNITSTLTESLGEKFTFVWKEEDQKGNPNAILLEKDPNSGFVKPVFDTKEGKEQIDKIKEVWGERLRLRLDQSVAETGKQEMVKPRVPRTPEERKARGVQEKINNSIFISDLIYGDQATKNEALEALKSYNRDKIKQYYFKEGRDANKNPVTNLVADVVDKTSQTGYSTQTIIPNFNQAEVGDIARSLIFDDYTRILNEEDRKFYEDSMASVILNNFGDYGLDAMQVVAVGDPGGTKSTRTMAPSLPYSERKVAEPGKGTTADAQTVFLDQVNSSVGTDDSGELVTALSISYLQVPEGQDPDVVALNRSVKGLADMSTDDVEAFLKQEGFTPKDIDYNAVKIDLDTRYSEVPYIIIPTWKTTAKATNEIMKDLEKITMDIEEGVSNNKLTKDQIKQRFTQKNWGKDDVEWFNIYNPAAGTSTVKPKPKPY